MAANQECASNASFRLKHIRKQHHVFGQSKTAGTSMKTCYIHVGFHKTASTSFQQFCGIHRDLLAESGLYYPKFVYPPQKGNLWNHTGPISMIYKRGRVKRSGHPSNSDDRKNLRATNQKRHLQALEQNKDLLISGEGLSCLTHECYRRLMEDLTDYGYNTKVFALVRPPYSFVCSALQEWIKGGRYSRLVGLKRSPKNNRSKINDLPHRSEAIKTLQQSFGAKIQFYPFSKALAHPKGPVGFCLDQLERPLPWASEQTDSAVHNPSLNNLQARTINHIIKELRGQKNQSRCSKSELKIIRESMDKLESERFLLTEQEFSLIEHHYKQIKQDIEQLLGPSFTDERLLFSSPITESDAIIDALARCSSLLIQQSRTA